MKLQVIQSGIARDLTNKQEVVNLVKTALPHRAEYIDKHGEAAFHQLLDELERQLLEEFQNMLAGKESDQASVERAHEIAKRASELSAKQSAELANRTRQPAS